VLDHKKMSGYLSGPLDDLIVHEVDLERPFAQRSELRGLQLISQRACKARDLDTLLSSVLVTLDEAFGFEHAMLLMPDESAERLFAVAARGYGDDGIGAEVTLGDGLIGSVARERKLLRVTGVHAELRYGRAIRAAALQMSGRRGLRPEIPLPGLPDAQSHMAMPLLIDERLVGVLAVESRQPLAFDDWDEAFLEIVANQVAVAIDNMLLRAANDDDAPAAPTPEAQPAAPLSPALRIRFFKSDDCNVPGRILWKLLRAHVDSGRSEFSNRELRLDAWLGLPPLRDNLESRLVLLRKRLEQKCPQLRLVSTSRGHFRLEASCRIELEDCEAAAV
jgi:adenylate cyclase